MTRVFHVSNAAWPCNSTAQEKRRAVTSTLSRATGQGTGWQQPAASPSASARPGLLQPRIPHQSLLSALSLKTSPLVSDSLNNMCALTTAYQEPRSFFTFDCAVSCSRWRRHPSSSFRDHYLQSPTLTLQYPTTAAHPPNESVLLHTIHDFQILPTVLVP